MVRPSQYPEQSCLSACLRRWPILTACRYRDNGVRIGLCVLRIIGDTRHHPLVNALRGDRRITMTCMLIRLLRSLARPCESS